MMPNSLALSISLALVSVGAPLLAKRVAPKPVSPVVVDSMRVSAPHSQMGFVVAVDVGTDQEIWRQRVYRVKYAPSLERDVQDVFITSLTIPGGSLLILNERGERYTLDLATRKVAKIAR